MKYDLVTGCHIPRPAELNRLQQRRAWVQALGTTLAVCFGFKTKLKTRKFSVPGTGRGPQEIFQVTYEASSRDTGSDPNCHTVLRKKCQSSSRPFVSCYTAPPSKMDMGFPPIAHRLLYQHLKWRCSFACGDPELLLGFFLRFMILSMG